MVLRYHDIKVGDRVRFVGTNDAEDEAFHGRGITDHIGQVGTVRDHYMNSYFFIDWDEHSDFNFHCFKPESLEFVGADYKPPEPIDDSEVKQLWY